MQEHEKAQNMASKKDIEYIESTVKMSQLQKKKNK
jgi:hypothetical protein